MRYGPPQAQYARLIPVAGGLAFESSFNRALLDDLKLLIPSNGRKWEPVRKAWIVDPQYGGICAKLAEQYLGVQVAIPQQAHMPNLIETRLLRIEYIGRCKARDTESSAFAYSKGQWSVIFPEEVLRQWFEATPSRPDEKPSLYSVLAVKQSATPDEIKKAFRRLAFQWHPDKCHEPDAAEQFKVINHAYEVLSDDLKRKKYNAGLAFESTLHSQPKQKTTDCTEYRSPLRCGWVLCEGKESLGRFWVASILQWEDVTDSAGRVMVVSWPVGANMFEVQWQ